MMENRTSANIKHLFLDFCNRNLPKMLKQEAFKVQFDTGDNAIIKDEKSYISLENFKYDEFGDFVVTGAFDPRYLVTEKKLEDGTKEVVVEIELLDTNYKTSVAQSEEGE